MPTNVGGADINDLLIYNTSGTATVFTVDNVSVKNLPYRNLTALTSADAAYDPQGALGGTRSSFFIEAASGSGSSVTTINVVDYNPGILTGLVVQSDSINVDGKNYVEITGGSMGGKTVVVASAIPVTAGDVFTVSDNPDSDTYLTV